MIAASNLMAEAQSSTRLAAEMQISPARRFAWLVRRELWENRSIYVAPLAVGAVALVGFLIATVQWPAKIRAASSMDPMKLHAVIEQPFVIVALILMLVDIVVAAIYSLDALYGERRDRSVLFWKSLPVSDFTTVLSKASIPILVLPVVCSVVTVVTQFLMLLVGSAVLAGNGMSASLLWTHVPFLQTAGINFYHLVVFHGLWYAPFFGWLLLVSAWARRTPLLWAVLPPLAVAIVEKIAFNTSYFAGFLLHRFAGSPTSAGTAAMGMDMLVPHHPGQFLVSAGLWLGLGLTAACLAAAARLRRSRGVV